MRGELLETHGEGILKDSRQVSGEAREVMSRHGERTVVYEMRRQVCFRSEGAEPEWRVHRGDVRALEITSRSSMKGKTGRANPRGQHGVLYENSGSGNRTYLSDATVSDADSFDGLHL